MPRTKLNSNKAQLSLDILIGLTVFMLAFVFILQYIPSNFITQENDVSLSSTAYRLAALLTESPGYWTNGTISGTDWENHWNNTVIVGLCVEDHPGMLSLKKINELQSKYEENKNEFLSTFSKMFGLKNYNYNISLQFPSSSLANTIYSRNNSGKILLRLGKPIPKYGNVVKLDRIVYLKNGLTIYNLTGKGNIVINATPPFGYFAIVITNRSVNGTPRIKVFVSSRFGNWGKPVFNIKPSKYPVTYNITNILNGNSTISTSGSSYIKINFHKYTGYAVYTNAGAYIAGRVVSKLVIYVW